MEDAKRQVKAAQKNVLADYRELNQLRGDYESLSDSSHQQDSVYRLLLHQLSIPSVRVQVLAIADALIGGRPIPISGGGSVSSSDLRWYGRNPDEEKGAVICNFAAPKNGKVDAPVQQKVLISPLNK